MGRFYGKRGEEKEKGWRMCQVEDRKKSGMVEKMNEDELRGMEMAFKRKKTRGGGSDESSRIIITAARTERESETRKEQRRQNEKLNETFNETRWKIVLAESDRGRDSERLHAGPE
ncbi:uncharacterized protein V6R79_009376 [Siganus canaliculatus]